MKNRIIIIILSAIIVILTAANVFMFRGGMEPRMFPGPDFMDDGPGMMKRPHMPGNRFGRNFCGPEFMKEKLNLNSDQINIIENLNRKFDSESPLYFEQIKTEKESLKNILSGDKPDMVEVRKKLERIASLNVELHLLKIKQGNEISKILSPEQRKTLHREREMFFEKMHRKHGNRNE